MCLISDTRIPSIAKKSIICYKKVRLLNKEECETPCIKAILKRGKLNVAKGPEQINIHGYSLQSHFLFGYSIGEGYIHAYQDKGWGCWGKDYVSVTCIIPKGTKYFVGSMDICANKMIVDCNIFQKFLAWLGLL